MDRQTIAYYDRCAAEAAAKFRGISRAEWREVFREAFPARGRVVDVGTGSGRDLAQLLAMGFDAYGFEPSVGMRGEAERAFPELVGRLKPFPLPIPKDSQTGAPYDGVLCSAVLMHVPESELPEAALSIGRLLKPSGRLLTYVLPSKHGVGADERDENRRLFTKLAPEFITALFERVGFRLLRSWEETDRLGRPGITWNGFLFELETKPSVQ
jgi:SAM-dependent methyltransferase